MKYYIFTIVLLFCFKGFTQKNDVIEFKYIASSRGVLNEVVIKKDSTFIKTFDRDQTIKTNSEKWDELIVLTKSLDLKSLIKLNSTSDKRFSDAALSAIFLIKTSNEIYESSSFDHGNPPYEIKELVNEFTIYLE